MGKVGSVVRAEELLEPGSAVLEARGETAWRALLERLLSQRPGDPAAVDRTMSTRVLRRPSEPEFEKLSVLMPVYNERWTLAEVVGRVLRSPVPLELELVVVDDGSDDGSWDVIQELAGRDRRIKAVRHAKNRGKGAAVRTAIESMTGDVAVIQDADLEYDPAEFPRLLEPILDGKADAVFGSRFLGETRRALPFWHALANKTLTLLSNALTNLSLTDMETCYKMVRADVLRGLRLDAETFTIEPELTCRLAQWGARVYEVPITYAGRTYEEGKKIRPWDGMRAIGALLRARFIKPRFTRDPRHHALARQSRARHVHAWLAKAIAHHLGQHVLHVGAGIGSLSRFLANRRRLVLVEPDPACRALLRSRFGHRPHVRIDQGQVFSAADRTWPWDEPIDTIVCSELPECLPTGSDFPAWCYEALPPGGRWVIATLPGPGTRNPADLGEVLAAAGFDVTHQETFGRLTVFGGPLGRWIERWLPIRKAGRIAVGRKPLAAQRRAAA